MWPARMCSPLSRPPLTEGALLEAGFGFKAFLRALKLGAVCHAPSINHARCSFGILKTLNAMQNAHVSEGSIWNPPLGLRTPATCVTCCRYITAPESLWMKQIGDILKQRYPSRKLPLFGYIPYSAMWAIGPLIGLRRDFIKCAPSSPPPATPRFEP